ncbi:MAG TPA: hypothetical protein PKG79_07690 [Propioniciclava tarda]|nr:hypothetical protein [Propioniciclava tarda]
MDPILLILLFAAGGLGWWWWQRRQPKPVEDEWVLPPADPGAASVLTRPVGSVSPEPAGPDASASTLNRDMLLDRSRTTELKPWDAVADSSPAAPPPSAPAPRPAAPTASGESLTREMLERRERTFDPRNWDNSPDA